MICSKCRGKMRVSEYNEKGITTFICPYCEHEDALREHKPEVMHTDVEPTRCPRCNSKNTRTMANRTRCNSCGAYYAEQKTLKGA